MKPEELEEKSNHILAKAREEECVVSLDLINEAWTRAINNLPCYLGITTTFYNRKVKPRAVRDLILKKALHDDNVCKLQSKWEAPYLITACFHAGSYRLATLKGESMKYSFNGNRLYIYYVLL